MDNYQTFDITEKVKKVIAKVPEDNMEAEIKIPISVIFDKDKFRRIARSKRLDKKRDQVQFLCMDDSRTFEICGADTGFGTNDDAFSLFEIFTGTDGETRTECGCACGKIMESASDMWIRVFVPGNVYPVRDGSDSKTGYLRMCESL